MKHIALSVSDAMASSKLLGPFFSGPSWNTWRTVIKAAFAERMTATEIETFRFVAERDPPTAPVSEMVAVVGRGGGKDSVATLIATSIAVNFDPLRSKLRPGEKAVVMLLAVDRAQAGVAFSYIKGYFEEVPALAKLVKHIGDDSIELRNRVVIEVHTNSYRSVRGRSLLCVVCDEVAFWRSEDSASPDVEVAGAVAPGLARVRGSMLILISTAHKRSGLLYQKWKEAYGRNDPDVLVVKGDTRTFNPTFDAKIIERQIASDPQLYRAEYLSEWRDDLSTFISRELLEASVDVGVLVRRPIDGVKYFAFTDASGGLSDSFTLAIGHHAKDGCVTLDLLFEKRPPFDPYAVTEEIVKLLKTYHCAVVVGDSYAAKWVSEAFVKAGVMYRKSDLDRSAIYLNVLPLFMSGRARLIDSPRLVTQFAGLERRTFPTGRDRVDHGRAGHDDLCNAAAGALVLASRTPAQKIPMVGASWWSKNTGWVEPGRGATNGGSFRAEPPCPQHQKRTHSPRQTHPVGLSFTAPTRLIAEQSNMPRSDRWRRRSATPLQDATRPRRIGRAPNLFRRG